VVKFVAHTQSFFRELLVHLHELSEELRIETRSKFFTEPIKKFERRS
jgi:hypothetical protein